MVKIQKSRLLIVLAAFMLVGGYWAYRLTSANHSPYVNIYANNVESNTTVYTNSSLVIYWQTLQNTGGYGCYTQGTWGYDRKLSDGYYPESGSENRSGDTATTGTKTYTIYCVMDEGNQSATVTVNVVSPPPPPPPPLPPKPAVSLSLNGQAANITLTQGAGLTLAWSSTNSPTSCTASWQGSPGTSGSANRTADTATTGVKTYTYSCSNAGGTGSISRSVTVTSSPAPPDNPPPPPAPPAPPPGSSTPPGSSRVIRPPSQQPPLAPQLSQPPQDVSVGLDIGSVIVTETSFTGAKISWATNKPATSLLEYSSTPDAPVKINKTFDQAATYFEATLENLEPGITYYFDITSSSGAEKARGEGEFNTRGFPVRIIIFSQAQKPLADAIVSIHGQTRTTDQDGNAYFELPAGLAEIDVDADGTQAKFSMTVEQKPVTNLEAGPEEQSFTFAIPAKSGGINFLKLLAIIALLALFAGGLFLLTRHRNSHKRKRTLDSDLFPLPSHYPQAHQQKHASQTSPPSPSLQTSTSSSPPSPPKAVAHPTGHHIPDWQLEIQQELKQSVKHDAIKQPKDMFELADEQFRNQEKLKKPPTHPPK